MCGQMQCTIICLNSPYCVKNNAEPCVIVQYVEMYPNISLLAGPFHYFQYYCEKRRVKSIQYYCH